MLFVLWSCWGWVFQWIEPEASEQNNLNGSKPPVTDETNVFRQSLSVMATASFWDWYRAAN